MSVMALPPEITIKLCTCKRCNYQWYPRTTEVPERCARCKDPNWQFAHQQKKDAPQCMIPEQNDCS